MSDETRQSKPEDGLDNVDEIAMDSVAAKDGVDLKNRSQQAEMELKPVVDSHNPKMQRACSSEVAAADKKQIIAVILALMLAMFLVSMDRTIITTAIPKMTDEFGTLDNIGWYGSAFMLASCSSQLLLGRIYTFYTPKYVFLVIIILFEIGSLLCATAPNSSVFIFGRAVAGVGSAGIMSGAIVLVVATIPLPKRPVYSGYFTACSGVASVAGPLLGGVFTTEASWRWCFYINLPAGALSFVVVLFLLTQTEAPKKDLSIKQQLAQLDLLGELFFVPGIVCLLLALQWGGSLYAWNGARIIVLLVLFGLLFVLFTAVQILRPDTATVPSRIVTNRSVAAGMWYTFFLASTLMVLLYYIPIWFQAIKGVSAIQSGINTIALVASYIIAAIIGGYLVGKVGFYKPFMMISSCIMPIGAGLISTFDVSTETGVWVGCQVLFGIGLGIGQQHGSLAAQTVLDKKNVPTGISLMFLCQMLGGAVFVSVAQNVLEARLVSGLVEVTDLDASTIFNTGATDIRHVVPPHDLQKVLSVYNSSLRHTFFVAVATSSLVSIGAAFVEWRSVKGKQGPVAKNSTDKV